MVLAVAILAIAGVSAHRYFSLERELTQSALARRGAFAVAAAATLSEKLDRVVDIGVSLASRVQFGQLAAAGRWDEAAEILRRVPEDFKFISRASLFDVRGVYRAGVPEPLPIVGQSFAHRDWYKGVSAGWSPYVSSAYLRATAPVQSVFATALPIRASDGKPIAILHLQTDMEPFFKWLAGTDSGLDETISVVDAMGQLVWHSRIQAHLQLQDFSALPGAKEALHGASGSTVLPGAGGADETVYSYAPVRHGWGLVVAEPSAEVFVGRNALLRTVLADSALIVLFVVAAILLGGKVIGQRRRQEADHAYRAVLERNQAALTRQAERLRIVHEVDRAIIADAEPQAVAAAVIEPLRELLGVPRAIVNLFDHETGEVEWLAAAGRHRIRVGPGVRYPQRLMGDFEALGRGEPQRIDVRALAPGAQAEAEALLASGVRYYMAVPMIASGELIGALSFGGENDNFPSEQVAIAQEVATQLAIALHQARLFDRIKRQAEELEVRVRERTTELQAANRELESFSYSVSHDLRAPLRAVDGFARMLEEDYGPRLDDEGRRMLHVVRESATRMGQLIDDLLSFSRVSRTEPVRAPVDMTALAREVSDEVVRGSPVQVELDALPSATGDRALLRQVWENLVANAHKFSGKRERPQLRIGGKANGTELIYWVRDNGAGFDMRYADKLFGVFQRLHRQEEFAGTGVGLAIVQRVVARHGGRVWAEGKPGEGACFYFALPKEAAAHD